MSLAKRISSLLAVAFGGILLSACAGGAGSKGGQSFSVSRSASETYAAFSGIAAQAQRGTAEFTTVTNEKVVFHIASPHDSNGATIAFNIVAIDANNATISASISVPDVKIDGENIGERPGRAYMLDQHKVLDSANTLLSHFTTLLNEGKPLAEDKESVKKLSFLLLAVDATMDETRFAANEAALRDAEMVEAGASAQMAAPKMASAEPRAEGNADEAPQPQPNSAVEELSAAIKESQAENGGSDWAASSNAVAPTNQ